MLKKNPDPHVNNLTDGFDVIVFDGVCILCSRFMKFVLKYDTKKSFKFILAQSDRGEALYRHLGLKDEDYSSNLVIIDGHVFTKMEAFVAVMLRLGAPWSATVVFKLLPNSLAEWLYDRVARNRYAIFGKTGQCLIPEPHVRARFLD